MRSFICYECGHRFQVAYGVGGPGAQMACPGCGGKNIHRVESDRGFSRVGRGRAAQGRWPRGGR